MNILLTVHHHLDVDAGAPGVTHQLALRYRALGHRTRVYSFDDLPEWIPAKVRNLVFPYFVAGCVSRLSRSRKIDVVDASSGDAWLWGTVRHKSRGPLLVTRSHGLEHTAHLERVEEARVGNLRLSWKYPLYHGGLRLWEVATSLRRSDLTLFLNRTDLDFAAKELGVRPERTEIVANGIPEAFLGLPFQTSPMGQDTPLRIAQVGSYIPRKGTQYAAPALNRILSRYPRVQVSFLGTGCSVNRVHADYDPPVRARVKVVPHYMHAELPGLLSGHHVKLFPTLSEGFSLALLEAMACGLAPVTTATPGPLELVRDGQDALVTPPRSSRAIEQALERLIADRTLLDRLRGNAHTRAQMYSWERISRQMLQLYEVCLQDRILANEAGNGK